MKTIAQPRRQRGMALIISLVLLLSMTLLALAAMQTTTLEERMAGNVRSENIALQAAESALRSAETALAFNPSRPVAVGQGSAGNPVDVWVKADTKALSGPYSISGVNAKKDWWAQWTPANWQAFADQVGTDLTFVAQKTGAGGAETVAQAALGTADPARQPRFVIEEFGLQQESLVIGQQQDSATQGLRYRITARGVDAGDRGEVLLQSRFLRRY